MELSPFLDQTKLPVSNLSFHVPGFDLNHCLLPLVSDMKVRGRVIYPVHKDYNTKETADNGHPKTLTLHLILNIE
jgi:hypothetical protein